MSGPKDLARELLFRPYQLIDIQRMSDNEIQQRELCGLMEFAFKYRAAQNFKIYLEKILAWIASIYLKEENYAKSVLEYLIDGVDMSDKELFIEKVNKHLSDSELKGETMTLSQIFREEGRQAGEATMLNRLLKLRFREVPTHYQSRIEQADAETLLIWAERVLAANSLDEIFN